MTFDTASEVWNLFFAGGILLGALLASQFLANPEPVQVSPALLAELKRYGIEDHQKLLPRELFSLEALFTLRGFVMMVLGGFLVGFGTRYAGAAPAAMPLWALATYRCLP